MGNRKNEMTAIQLSKDTKNKLTQLGTKQDTFEDIVKRLLEKAENK